MDSSQKNLTWVGSGQPSLWVWIWKFSPKYPIFFNFLPFWSKKCHWVRSKSTRVSLFFTAGQKYARVGSGQDPSLFTTQHKVVWSSGYSKLDSCPRDKGLKSQSRSSLNSLHNFELNISQLIDKISKIWLVTWKPSMWGICMLTFSPLAPKV